jgi:hypothetical protein
MLPEKKYKIRLTISGNTLTYDNCTLLEIDDDSLLKFKDKYDKVFLFSKNTLLYMEELTQ